MTFELNVIIHKGKQNIINKKNELKFVHVLCVVKVKHHDSSCMLLARLTWNNCFNKAKSIFLFIGCKT